MSKITLVTDIIHANMISKELSRRHKVHEEHRVMNLICKYRCTFRSSHDSRTRELWGNLSFPPCPL